MLTLMGGGSAAMRASGTEGVESGRVALCDLPVPDARCTRMRFYFMRLGRLPAQSTAWRIARRALVSAKPRSASGLAKSASEPALSLNRPSLSYLLARLERLDCERVHVQPYLLHRTSSCKGAKGSQTMELKVWRKKS